MRRPYAKALAVLGIATALGLVTSLWPRQPAYMGRTLRAWLADLDLESSHDPRQAEQAIRAIGTNALPALLKMVCAQDSLWERAVAAIERHQSALRLRFVPASAVRYRAILGYRILGATAAASVPALIDVLSSPKAPEVRASAATALGAIGPAAGAAVPALARAAGEGNAEVRRNALLALVNIQRSAESPTGSPTRY